MHLPDKFISREDLEQKKVSNYHATTIVKDTTCPNCGLSTSIQTHLNEKEPMLTDGRYLTPKETSEECSNAFGGRIGLGEGWEKIYDEWTK